jgi:hypothetical protein
VKEAHHSLEPVGAHSKDPKAKVKAALLSLNPKRMLLEAKRWHNMKSVDPEFGEHAKNLAFLLPFSESLELSTGPVMTWVVVQTDLPLWLEGLMLGGGYAISTPFIVEPYCAAMAFAYISFPKFRNMISSTRKWTTRAAESLCEVTGLKSAFDRSFPVQDLLWSLVDDGWLIYQEMENKEALFAQKVTASGGRVLLELGFHEGYYVRKISVENVASSELNSLLSIFNWSARELMALESKGSDFSFEFRNREVLLKNKRKFCGELLKPQ